MVTVAESLVSSGFTRIGELRYGLDLAAWWHPEARIQFLSLSIGGAVLLKGSKAYFLTSVTEDGETWARDIPALHDYLESHFREIHLSFSFVRDVPAFLAERHGRKRHRSGVPHHSPPCEARRALERARQSLAGLQRLSAVSAESTGVLRSHLNAELGRKAAEVESLRRLLSARVDDQAALKHLQTEYRSKGSAASLTFSVSSNLHVAATSDDVGDVARSVIKELSDADRFQVRQTLGGGKLQIGVEEASEPLLAWIEQWFGGLLNPSQLERLLGQRHGVLDAMTGHVVVTPDEDIRLGPSVVDHRKLLAPRVVSSLIQRIDPEGARQTSRANADAGPVINLGLCMENDRVTKRPCDLLLREFDHVFVSGMTRSGKSVGVRVLCEEIAVALDVGVLVIDPRNQAAGILLPQDQLDLLAHFERFGDEAPCGFPFAYYAPANPAVPPLPKDLDQMALGRNVLSLKGLADEDRCRTFHRVVESVFAACSRQESASVRLVLIVEEAHLFTERLVGPDAKGEARRAVGALDRVLREGRKYGLCAVVSSQSIKDFARDAASIRQNAGTKIFFHNSDRELEYVRDYLDDPRALTRLRPGEAFICNPHWGTLRVAFKPSLSKVWDLSDAETAALVRVAGDTHQGGHTLSPEARKVLQAVKDHVQQTGVTPNMSQVAEAARVTSKRRLQELVRELVSVGVVVTRRLETHGRPRVLELTGKSAHDPDEAARITGQERMGGGR